MLERRSVGEVPRTLPTTPGVVPVLTAGARPESAGSGTGRQEVPPVVVPTGPRRPSLPRPGCSIHTWDGRTSVSRRGPSPSTLGLVYETKTQTSTRILI